LLAAVSIGTRAGDVDDAVWAWIESMVLNEDNLREGLRKQQESVENERAKLDDMRARFLAQRLDPEAQAARLLRAYTSGVFSLEELAGEKRQIETAKRAIEVELAELDRRLADLTLASQEVKELAAFAAEVKRKLADLTFESKRRAVDLLDVRVVLKMVDGQRYADVTCKLTLHGETLPVESSSRQAKGTRQERTDERGLAAAMNDAGAADCSAAPSTVSTSYLTSRHNPVKAITFATELVIHSSSRLSASQ
jgi:hypothetical protein